MATPIAYTRPPTWFTSNSKNKDAVLELTKRGWVATFPDGRTEIVVGMKNVPEEFLKKSSGTSKIEEKPAKQTVVESEPQNEEIALADSIGEMVEEGVSKKIKTNNKKKKGE